MASNSWHDDAKTKLATKYGGTKFLADYLVQNHAPAHAGDTPPWSIESRRREWYAAQLTAASIPFPAGGFLPDLAAIYWKNIAL